jgi:hypothetical protein
MNNHIKQKFEKKMAPNKKDQKFYRKRILALTKELLYQDDEENQNQNQKASSSTGDNPPVIVPGPDVRQSFNSYIKGCIEHFKMTDKTDILQESYADMMNDVPDIPVECGEYNQEEANQLMMRSVKMNAPTMDKFVKRTLLYKEDPPPLPTQKKLNLKDPALKVKGLPNNEEDKGEKKDTKEKKEKKKKDNK